MTSLKVLDQRLATTQRTIESILATRPISADERDDVYLRLATGLQRATLSTGDRIRLETNERNLKALWTERTAQAGAELAADLLARVRDGLERAAALSESYGAALESTPDETREPVPAVRDSIVWRKGMLGRLKSSADGCAMFLRQLEKKVDANARILGTWRAFRAELVKERAAVASRDISHDDNATECHFKSMRDRELSALDQLISMIDAGNWDGVYPRVTAAFVAAGFDVADRKFKPFNIRTLVGSDRQIAYDFGEHGVVTGVRIDHQPGILDDLAERGNELLDTLNRLTPLEKVPAVLVVTAA